jgi:hypothetical protein
MPDTGDRFPGAGVARMRGGLRGLVLGAVLVLSGVAAGFALGSGPEAHAEVTCSVEAARGSYAVSGTGFIFGPPWAITGLVVFDGAGRVTANVLESYGGVIDDATFQGTYTMGPDCRGVLNVTHMDHRARAGHEHVTWRQDVHRVEFVGAAGGQRIYWILVDTFPEAVSKGVPEVSDPTVIASGVLERI